MPNGLTKAREHPLARSILSACVGNTKATAKVFFPHRFERSFSSAHEPLFKALDKPSKRKRLILAPRGFGKTTLMLTFVAEKILFQRKKFILLVSKSNTLATQQSQNLKEELTSNQRILQFFPPLKSEDWSEEKWLTTSGIRIIPRGARQGVRGLLHQHHRPDLIIVDDLEDDILVQSEEQRDKLKEWFMSALMNTVDYSKDDWEIVVIGTILHEASLLTQLMKDPSWETVRIDLCDENYNSLWPDYMTTERIKEVVEDYRHQGKLDLFYREFRNLPIASETAAFKTEHFRYYDESKESLNTKTGVDSFILIDPAKTVRATAAESAIIGVAIDARSNALYVRDIAHGHMMPDEVFETALSMGESLNARAIGVEVTSLNEFILQPFRNYMLATRRNFDIVELHARGKKEDRIRQGLSGYYRRGWIYHNPNVCAPLEEQLLSFPRSEKWDIMDALAYIAEMLDHGDRFFFPLGSEESRKAVDSEYKDLMKDDYADEHFERAMVV